MVNFKTYISEAKEETDIEIKNKLVADIEKEFKSQFPNAWFFGSVRAGLGLPHVSIDFGFVNKSELTSNILDNDPVHHSFMFHDEGSGKFNAVRLRGGISINPPEGSYLAMDTVKTKFRKTTGDDKRILKTFKTFFKRLKVLVKDNEQNIYQRKKYSDKYFRF